MTVDYFRVMKDSDEVINIADFISPEPVSSEKLLVDDPAGGVQLTAAIYASAKMAAVQIETAPVRVTVDGTPPTAAYGRIYEPGDELYLESHTEIVRFRAIRITGTSASLNVDYSV